MFFPPQFYPHLHNVYTVFSWQFNLLSFLLAMVVRKCFWGPKCLSSRNMYKTTRNCISELRQLYQLLKIHKRQCIMHTFIIFQYFSFKRDTEMKFYFLGLFSLWNLKIIRKWKTNISRGHEDNVLKFQCQNIYYFLKIKIWKPALSQHSWTVL